MVEDTSFYDTCTKLNGSNLERLASKYQKELEQDLQDCLETGGCFEDEGFLRLPCNGEVITIKPLIWFRSRREALELVMMILQSVHMNSALYRSTYCKIASASKL